MKKTRSKKSRDTVPLMRDYVANNVSGMYLEQVSLHLIGQQGLGHFFRFASYWLGDCANFTPKPEDYDQK